MADIQIGSLSLPIVDCKHWHVLDRTPNCELGLDVARCDCCASKVNRQGDYMNPPVYRRSRALAHPTPLPPVKPRGMGDVIAAVAKALGFKQKPNCGCSKRQEALNRIMPFTPG